MHKAKVFISCGQSSKRERDAAAQIKDRLKREGYETYVAIEKQNMDDIFSGIIKHLKLSDYYLFIDFAREAVFPIDKSFKPNNLKKCPRRGSLFTHQELAIAAILEFENSILGLSRQSMYSHPMICYTTD